MISDNVGLTYHDECFTFSLTFSENRSATETARALKFKLGLRTIGEYENEITGDDFEEFTEEQGL